MSARSPCLVVDVEPGRGRNILRVHDIEVLLPETLLPRLEVRHADDGLLRIVERNVLHVVRIRIVGARKTEIKELRPPEIVHRQRCLPEGALRDVAHLFAEEGVVDPPVGERRVERAYLHAVVVALDAPAKIVQGADRIAEKIRFERLADPAFLLGRILRLAVLALLSLLAGLLVRVCTVKVPRLPALLGTLQRPGVETLRTYDAGRCKEQTEQSCQQYSIRQPRHGT